MLTNFLLKYKLYWRRTGFILKTETSTRSWKVESLLSCCCCLSLPSKQSVVSGNIAAPKREAKATSYTLRLFLQTPTGSYGWVRKIG